MRTLDIIEYVVAHRHGVVTQEIANALSIPMSSLSYLLATLTDRGYLRREGRRFLAGPGLDRLRVADADLSLEERVAPLVRSVRAELNETASFMVRDGWQARTLVTESADQALRYAIEPGQCKPLHSLAAGKIILASLSDDELNEYFAQAIREKITDRTIVDENTLRAQLAEARESGFAHALEESTPGICSIGAAVIVGGSQAGAIGVAIPTIRFSGQLRARAQAALRRVSRALASD